MATVLLQFEDISISALEALSAEELDALPFGVIGMDASGITQVYNATESKLAGLSRERVLGQPFFSAIAQCMNNYLVAQRFEDETDLDETIPYVLTLRMRPTPVRLRMLAAAGASLHYVLIER